jgi:lysozyme
MINLDKMADLLERHEGRRRYPYRDSVGLLTIGIGFNLDEVGLYDEEMDFIVQNRIRKTFYEVWKNIPQSRVLCNTRMSVLVDMAYNMGIHRLLGFKKMFLAIMAGDFDTAAAEMLDSKWATQVGGRAIRLANMMRTGLWEDD